MELPCWNSPWPRGAVLQCPDILHYLYMFLQLFAFFAFHIYFWPYIFGHFGNKNLSILCEKRPLISCLTELHGILGHPIFVNSVPIQTHSMRRCLSNLAGVFFSPLNATGFLILPFCLLGVASSSCLPPYYLILDGLLKSIPGNFTKIIRIEFFYVFIWNFNFVHWPSCYFALLYAALK